MTGASWWTLLDSAEAASASDAVAFIQAAIGALPDLDRWEPMLDPLARVPGIADAWRASTEPVRSFLGHGLLREGLVVAHELPADLCRRVAASYLTEDDRAFLYEALCVEAAGWPAGVFAAAVRAAALASDEPLPFGLVRFAEAGASPRDVILLASRAQTEWSLDAEPIESWGRLRCLSEAELDVLETIAAAPPRSALSRFRIFRALLDHGRATPDHDVLLCPEWLEWVGDLRSNPPCGLCGEPELPHEPSLAVAHLLSRLPLERALRYLDGAEQSEVRTLFRAWLTQGVPAFRAAAAGLPALPEPVRAAILFAGARLMVAEDGHLPRLLQQEVLATLRSRRLPVEPPQPTAVDLSESIHTMRGRVKRLLELSAPIGVLMRDASRLRMLERLERVGVPLAEDSDDGEGEGSPSAREIALSLSVLRELAGDEPRLKPAIEQLQQLASGERVLGPNAAATFEAADEDSPDDVGHYAFCALDVALDDAQRTDQDDPYDIAERALRLGTSAEDVERRRAFWLRWLLEHVVRVASTACAP